MPEIRTVLVANRGEIAIRVLRAASELGLRTVAVYSTDDAASLHVRRADVAVALGSSGAAAYLGIDRVLALAVDAGADAIHPGYGFLSESVEFARRCADAGVVFIGPTPDVLTRFGDKAAARALAVELGVPVMRGTDGGVSVDGAVDFLRSLGGAPMILKATAGGGGRGSRIVGDPSDVAALYERCRSEALAAFGDGTLFAEELMANARHIEVQIIGDGGGNVSHLGERDCSIQRRHQKLVEIAPAPGLDPAVRHRLTSDAVRMASAVGYSSLGTFEFLVDAGTGRHVFIEANPRLQVEHTVTEEVLGIDLVQAQIRLATGESLSDLGLDQASVPMPRGVAVQCRVNMETMLADGTVRPGGGELSVFEVPSGPGYRTDSFGYAGYRTSASFDSLLAKVIVHTPSPRLEDALRKADRALRELRIEGAPTNVAFLRALVTHDAVRAGRATTRFVDESLTDLLAAPDAAIADPLAVLDHAAASTRPRAHADGPDGAVGVSAPMQGTVVQIAVAEGDAVSAGQELLIMEAMKMEHAVVAARSGFVRRIDVSIGDTVYEDGALLYIEPADVDGLVGPEAVSGNLDEVRADAATVIARHELTLDAARPEAIARRRKTAQRTARENIDDLCEAGTFSEYGSLAYAAGADLSAAEAIRKYPADGMVCGVGAINADLYGPDASRAVVLSYDYTVLAGTQGSINHPKTDRMLDLAGKWKLPVVFFTEGGGGRAGTGGSRSGESSAEESGAAAPPRSGLSTPTWIAMARLNGVVPTVAINSGRCFAGNAALFGGADVTIATEYSNIGMGGPAMIEGGGLGVYSPDEVGPIEVQLKSGVVDIAVADEAEAVAVAKKYLSYFQGRLPAGEAGDQRVLRNVVPENRLRSYEIRDVIEGFTDIGSFLELRRHFGLGMVTGFARVEGRPIGVLANNPKHLGGAIDSDGADKAARFMQLVDAFDIPLVVLCDTPGIMVGPEVEKTGLVRHANRVFLTGANLTIPTFMVVVRKAIGLGAMAMGGGSLKAPMFAVGWPTSEIAGMGLEGQVKLGYRIELAAIADPAERAARYNQLVAKAYESSKGIHHAEGFGLDDVIDPADTRQWIAQGLRSVEGRVRAEYPRRVDVW
ncbi:MAG: carbamoyl-phosphate synthase large subunit [Jatrophihabitantaceae bacterium]|nr:carbamoyl-phosphate synthase large subunit [Jatrophihabitantaceae bacterium]